MFSRIAIVQSICFYSILIIRLNNASIFYEQVCVCVTICVSRCLQFLLIAGVVGVFYQFSGLFALGFSLSRPSLWFLLAVMGSS